MNPVRIGFLPKVTLTTVTSVDLLVSQQLAVTVLLPAESHFVVKLLPVPVSGVAPGADQLTAPRFSP